VRPATRESAQPCWTSCDRNETKRAIVTDVTPATAVGLSTEVARQRLATEGHNELPRNRARSFASSAVRALAEPMFLLLLGAAGIYLLLGDRTEALILLASVAVIIVITIYQERKTERVLDALRDLSTPAASHRHV
jgi:Ca2+-transporting ATPase